jgi:predicted transcriptional regulator
VVNVSAPQMRYVMTNPTTIKATRSIRDLKNVEQNITMLKKIGIIKKTIKEDQLKLKPKDRVQN